MDFLKIANIMSNSIPNTMGGVVISISINGNTGAAKNDVGDGSAAKSNKDSLGTGITSPVFIETGK